MSLLIISRAVRSPSLSSSPRYRQYNVYRSSLLSTWSLPTYRTSRFPQGCNIIASYPQSSSLNLSQQLINNSISSINIYQQHQQKRCISLPSLPPLPEPLSKLTIWGGTGIILKSLHYGEVIPYWACMSLTAVILRTALIPLVLDGAKTAANFAKVAPEIQFLVTMFMNDREKLKRRGAGGHETRELMKATRDTIWNIYKVYNINPWAVFKSPLIQIPCFWYFAVDIRKIISGLDPQLARDLSEGGALWFPDLTDPDPYFVLPMISGALLYLNVEIAMGRHSLSGETASKANVAVYLKDFFQSLSIFIPCFMATSTAGVQIYLVTSFTFTLFQSAALRNDTFRNFVNLPSLNIKYDAALARDYQKLLDQQREAIQKRGDKPVLGTGVLAPGWVASFEGETRKSTIANSNKDIIKPEQTTTSKGLTQSPTNLMVTQERTHIPNIPFEVMDAANKGMALPRPIVMAPKDNDEDKTVVKPFRIKKQANKKTSKQKTKNNRSAGNRPKK